ncbi:MAG: DUF6786 family protein [Candidatus Zhuqueibacterota bacterium]
MITNVNDLVRIMKKQTQIVVLGDEAGALLAIAPEYGGKVVALGLDGLPGKNLIWPNPALAKPEFWAGETRNWNIGGARSWISPEATFYLDKQQNWFVPEVMDPGKYTLDSREANRVVCSNDFEITNVVDQVYHLKLVRSVELLTSPSEELAPGVRYVGLKFTHELYNLSDVTIGKDVDHVGLWSLIQLDTAGTMIIPITRDSSRANITVRDYGPKNFNTVPPERLATGDDWASVKIDGKFRCKLGIAPWAARNGIAYLSYKHGSDEGILYLKQFHVDPAGLYLDRPWERAYDYGDAIQMYNDDGRFGGFCEIECHGPAKDLAPNEKLEQTVTFSVYVGNLAALKTIAGEKLGVNMDEVKLY